MNHMIFIFFHLCTKKKITEISYDNFTNFNFEDHFLDNHLKNFSDEYFLKYNNNKIEQFFLI